MAKRRRGSDPGAADPESGPRRTCLISRSQHPRERLLRFTTSPEGLLTEDLTGRLPGRGIYLYPSRENVLALAKRLGRPGRGKKSAGRRGASARGEGNGQPAEPLAAPDPEALIERLGRGLSRRLADGIGLARRAGAARVGVREATEALERGERPLLLLAADTAEHTRQKVRALVVRHGIEAPLELLDREGLGAACGRGPAALIAIVGAGLERRVAVDAARWRAFFITG